MKKTFPMLFFTLLSTLFLTVFVSAAELQLNSASACLMEPSTGRVLYEKNADERLEPASVTKIMSLILVFEAMDEGKFDLNTEVCASEYSSSMGGSQIWLEPGETMSVNEMLTYLNTSYSRATHTTQITRQDKYITDLKKLNGLHILNNDINPATIIPMLAIVTN